MVTRFVASPPTDNSSQRKEAQPLSHALTSDEYNIWTPRLAWVGPEVALNWLIPCPLVTPPTPRLRNLMVRKWSTVPISLSYITPPTPPKHGAPLGARLAFPHLEACGGEARDDEDGVVRPQPILRSHDPRTTRRRRHVEAERVVETRQIEIDVSGLTCLVHPSHERRQQPDHDTCHGGGNRVRVRGRMVSMFFPRSPPVPYRCHTGAGTWLGIRVRVGKRVKGSG
jgi:hypothetical protein